MVLDDTKKNFYPGLGQDKLCCTLEYQTPPVFAQETDRNYGLLKCIYWEIVEKFARDHEQLEKYTSISIALAGMFMFGGTHPETGCKYTNAFEAAFCRANYLEACKKVEAYHLT